MACYRHHRLLILCLTSFLLLSSTTADDAAVMLRLFTFISPTPPTWKTINFCVWEGISCGDSNRVISINLASKSLTGILPPNLNQLDQLKTLALQRNFFSGPLPTLANLTHLEQVILDSNNFTSIPSDFLLGLTNLQSFSISDNIYLSPWLLPTDLNQSSSLQTFEASSANLTGSIPEIFDSFPNLHTLRLSYNSLTGTLPETFSGSRIVNLYLNNQFQGLSGTIDVISSMIKLNQVWLHANSFTGAIPELSELTDLFDLQLWDNQFTGLVPPSLTTLPKLANITLRNNKLQGPLPVFGGGVLSELGIESNSYCLDTPGVCDHQVTILLDVAGAIGYPVLLSEFWQGNDACRRWKFVICDSSGKNVTGVNFGKMNFSGSISPSFANLTSLKILSLNDNNLVGSIPETLTSLPDLQSLDVSNNNLSGVMPKFPETVRVLYQNNLLLGQNIPNTSVSYSSPSGQLKGTHVSAGMVIGIVIGVLVLVGIVLFVSYKCYIKSIYQMFGRVGDLENCKELVKGGITGSNGFESGNVMISVQVLREVTDNFNEDNVLGRGGFGVVYKGELHDGTKIAVKRMKSGVMGTKGLKEFEAEIAVLTNVRHRHLVALLGYCTNDDERLLVYEYMPQGTLSQHLFEWRKRKSHPLSWKQRVLIALDVARGVEYLHSLAQQSFIHRDLKPLNILLGDDMRAKVADFGLVRNVPDGKHFVETRLAGTFGYLAPEYTTTTRVTTKVDVYAFGVVLMELITGRKALDSAMPDTQCHLATQFRRVLVTKENILKSIDETLETDDQETLENIVKVAELAGHCTTPKPFERPDMGHVVNVLGPLVEQWKPSLHEEEAHGVGHRRRTSLPEDFLRWQADESTSIMFDMAINRTV